MLLKIFLTSLLYVVISITVFGQDTTATDTSTKKVIVVVDKAIEDINETYKAAYKLYGYRIQLASESSSAPARKIRAAFIQKYKEVPAYEIYQQPYFKVRVGDFKTKLEAIKFQKEISSDYPNCYIVKDEIEFKKDN
ncbi:MAG: SPOR domain-containing protein [Flavobacteriales bacterium]|nr:SPOR domain-containing protein [Flavobacteriales bacterium]MCW8913128.1 SPOR domain-containing protein [Flavobacteriales bacterium]MCW8937791.1 SPOR domain-containing protein [Flavobacteriales bacterium]MCW8940041.1 SPOR domain-containing protein [Flavobacteriales bacterium]MCW8967397.1 SPOR domain-containing protein [Flavobacteriales bacterium]